MTPGLAITLAAPVSTTRLSRMPAVVAPLTLSEAHDVSSFLKAELLTEHVYTL
jgi:hypothetical protein